MCGCVGGGGGGGGGGGSWLCTRRECRGRKSRGRGKVGCSVCGGGGGGKGERKLALHKN